MTERGGREGLDREGRRPPRKSSILSADASSRGPRTTPPVRTRMHWRLTSVAQSARGELSPELSVSETPSMTRAWSTPRTPPACRACLATDKGVTSGRSLSRAGLASGRVSRRSTRYTAPPARGAPAPTPRPWGRDTRTPPRHPMREEWRAARCARRQDYRVGMRTHAWCTAAHASLTLCGRPSGCVGRSRPSTIANSGSTCQSRIAAADNAAPGA